MALGVLRHGEPVTAYYGLADVRSATPVTPSTRFGIGSLAKSMVASALAVLDAEHQLSLDDPGGLSRSGAAAVSMGSRPRPFATSWRTGRPYRCE